MVILVGVEDVTARSVGASETTGSKTGVTSFYLTKIYKKKKIFNFLTILPVACVPVSGRLSILLLTA